MEINKYSRKHFLRAIGGSLFNLSLASVFALGCTNNPRKELQSSHPAPLKNCDDLTGLTENDINLRTQFGYESISSVPDRLCSNCSLFIKPSSPENCGGCMLFKGPVNAEGSCIQFAIKK